MQEPIEVKDAQIKTYYLDWGSLDSFTDQLKEQRARFSDDFEVKNYEKLRETLAFMFEQHLISAQEENGIRKRIMLELAKHVETIRIEEKPKFRCGRCH